MNTTGSATGLVERRLRRALFISLLTLAPLASAQTVTVTLDLQSSLAGKVGSISLSGQSFGSGIPLDPSSSNPAVAVIGRFHSATLARDRAGTLAALCPATQSEYAELVADDEDLQFAADFLAPFTTRTALRQIQFGNYFVVFAELKGPGVDRYIRNYAVKSVDGTMCMTMDLRGDATYNTTVNLVTASLGG